MRNAFLMTAKEVKALWERDKAHLLKRRYGVKLTDEVRRKISIGNTGKKLSHEQVESMRKRTGPKASMWGKKAEKSPFYRDKHCRWIDGVPRHKYTLHRRIIMLYGKADHCESSSCEGRCKRFDWSNKRHDYKSIDRRDWQQLCRTCHIGYDKRENNYKGRKNA